ncbi:flagellar hook-associated protein FlgL [Caldibacillus sp. 210928-DFI.2.22]|uniref:flagellar hook-associated protein FlgL n=1 Tax=unclassified Caldibacillus TaxID=2641266 RepID=UPI001D08A09E|nr:MULTISPECIES: flagellar hook-associated protein FlgL [unclassified Caldibacillus]MCB7071263.1 flagellar hook-associated protein FlgL [Caldibacillus sp. 210928-DFI.2.22]MCB7074732.1 flagellar hook-associated protein FlgL [Caldibacillus sp. 210928-DFI.2.18]
MRVTQSMLSNNMLRNLSNNYNKMGKLQDQLTTQKRITRPSDDPVVAMLGLGYRDSLNKVQQYSRNISEATNWLDSTDDAISQGVKVLQRIRELTVQASNGTYEEGQRGAIAVEVDQLKKQLETIAQTQVGGKYIFNGENTNKAPAAGNFSDGDIELEIFDGIKLNVNTKGSELFKSVFNTLDSLKSKLEDKTASDTDISGFLDTLDSEIDHFLKIQADVGAKQNRVDMMKDRLSSQETIATEIMSKNEDVEIEKVITELITQESVQRAALSVGARIIQPSLVDFLR